MASKTLQIHLDDLLDVVDNYWRSELQSEKDRQIGAILDLQVLHWVSLSNLKPDQAPKK